MNNGARTPVASPPGTESAPSPHRVKESKAAVFSLVVSVFGAISIPFLFGAPCLVGIVLGIVGLRRIKGARGAQKGAALAIAGIVLGVLFLALGVAIIHANFVHSPAELPCLYGQVPGLS